MEKVYKSCFIVWRDPGVPKIMFQPKWYNSDKDLQVGDFVHFQKKESKANQPWTVGRVEQIVRSDRDDLIRRAIIKYQNHGEELPQLTDRNVRKLVNQDRGRTDQDDVDHQEDLTAG